MKQTSGNITFKNKEPNYQDMIITDLIKKVEESKPYNDWSKNNSGKLAHIFFIEGGLEAFDIGYYLEKEDKIASFEISGDRVIFKGSSDPFKEPNKKIKSLNIEKVKIDYENALKTASELQKEKYKTEIPFKQITILQNIDEGQVWNFTFITQAFKTLNIKIDAKTGEIVKDELINLMGDNK